MNLGLNSQSSPSRHGTDFRRGPVITFWFLMLAGIWMGAWIFLPHWKTVYSGNEGTVKYRELGPYLVMNVVAKSGTFPTFRFDYWQDGLRHKINMLKPSESKVEPIYGVAEDGSICAQYGIFDVSATNYGSTICGGLISSATVSNISRDATHWSYTLAIPKQELSSNEESASMVIDFWDKETQSSTSYPPERFRGPAQIQYGKGPLDRWLPH